MLSSAGKIFWKLSFQICSIKHMGLFKDSRPITKVKQRVARLYADEGCRTGWHISYLSVLNSLHSWPNTDSNSLIFLCSMIYNALHFDVVNFGCFPSLVCLIFVWFKISISFHVCMFSTLGTFTFLCGFIFWLIENKYIWMISSLEDSNLSFLWLVSSMKN